MGFIGNRLRRLCFGSLIRARAAGQQFGSWFAVRSADAVPQREVLPEIVVEEQVVDGMVGRSVDDGLERVGHDVVAVVDGRRPEVDDHVQAQVHELVQREQEHVQVVRSALQESVDRVESVARKWRRYLPLVVRLVKFLTRSHANDTIKTIVLVIVD